ncbi:MULTISPECIES: response regulator [Spirosoma]|uniref:Response regulator n=1 Tax=Spirosoma liriopis TaxID=2937440 RepID=A0ABT0HLJ0_9BACT|nr:MULTISPECIES: response regulator [Spirosoma]MCK8493008.1 response regulator [Spirosoma liriopis]UHG92407.1 response regulator [Spirosoma oryzicola]
MNITRQGLPISNANFKHASLLVIEDNDDHWHLIQLAIRRSLPEVKEVRVTNSEEAIAYLDSCFLTGEDLPKLILLDLYLPGREQGWNLLKQLKHDSSSYKQVPVVILSYSNNREDITESYFYGSTSYITKPTDVKQWEKYIQTLRVYWWETVTLPNDRLVL